jgi:hypothetical protein
MNLRVQAWVGKGCVESCPRALKWDRSDLGDSEVPESLCMLIWTWRPEEVITVGGGRGLRCYLVVLTQNKLGTPGAGDHELA